MGIGVGIGLILVIGSIDEGLEMFVGGNFDIGRRGKGGFGEIYFHIGARI